MLTRTDDRQTALTRHERPEAIVIGAGFGGLAAAVRLGARGYRVTVLERLDQPGGRARVFRQDGFVFDAGPTIITAPFLFEELWALAGERMADHVELRPVDPFYTIRFDDGDVFRYSGDPDAMRAEVRRISPSDEAGFERLMARSEDLCRVAFEALGHKSFGRAGDMARAAPNIVRFGGHRSVHHIVASYLKHPKLRIVFSFHPLLIGGNPFTASAVYGLIPYLEQRWGVHCAMGGTGALVRGLVELIERQGGSVRINTDVDEILVEDGRAKGVRLSTGECLYADIVVSNADSATTLHDLLSDAPKRRWSRKAVARARHSMGLFVWYFGVNRKYDDVGHHTIMLGPRYRGLLTDIFDRQHLADDFSLYLHRPTEADPSLAPEGCDTFYVLSPVPNLSADIDWHAAAEPYRKSIERRLSETLLPGLEQAVVTSRTLTPLDFRDDYRAFQGSAFSLEPVLFQSAWFRPHNRLNAIKNLFLVGAGTHPGAGVPGVLSSAKVLDEVVPDAFAFT